MMQSDSLWIDVHPLLRDDVLLLGRPVEARLEARLDRADLPPERLHVDDEVLDDRQVPHRGDHGDVPVSGDVVHARLAGEHRAAVHAHPARAADHHPAALAVRERAVDAVLDDVEAVEQRRLVGHVDLVRPERALARRGVVAPDLERDLHVAPFDVVAALRRGTPTHHPLPILSALLPKRATELCQLCVECGHQYVLTSAPTSSCAPPGRRAPARRRPSA